MQETFTIQFPRGSAIIRRRPTVGGRELLQEVGFDAMSLLQDKYPDVDLDSLKDLQGLDPRRLDGKTLRAFNTLNRAGIVAFVKSWSLGAPPTMDTVGELDADQYDSILEQVAPLIQTGMLGAEFEPNPDPASPTAPSSDLNLGLRAETTSAPSDSQTIELSSFTRSTDTDSYSV